MEMTRERISFTFDPKDMLLFLQIGFSFVRAAMVSGILEKLFVLKPSSETTTPRFLKLVTYSAQLMLFYLDLSFSLSLSLWMTVVLFVTSLVLSVLISIFYLVQVLSRFSTRAFSSCSSSARASMYWQTADWSYVCRLC